MKQPNCLPCQGIQILTPRTRHNRAGLDSLKYRVGTHAAFLETMLATLAAQQINVSLDPDKPHPITPLNNRLTARSADDPSIAMLDAWSMIADILAFYQERNANEGYLRTATQYRSVHELSRLVGYTPRPGLASSVYLAFEVEAPPANPTALISLPVLGASQPSSQGDTAVLIPKGTPAKSTPVPGSGDQPQHFETSKDLIARPEWNVIRPRQTRPIDISLGELLHLDELYFKGIGLRLEPNDLLAIAIGSGDEIQPSKVVKVLAVEESPQDQRTKVVLQPDSLSVPQLCRVVETHLNTFLTKLRALSLEARIISNVTKKIQTFITARLPELRETSLPDADSEIHAFSATTFLGTQANTPDEANLPEISKASVVANKLVLDTKVHADTTDTRAAYVLAHTQLTAAVQALISEADQIALSDGFSSIGDAEFPKFSKELQSAFWKLIRSQADVPNGLSLFLGRPSLINFDAASPTPLKAALVSDATGAVVGFKYSVKIIAGQGAGDTTTETPLLSDTKLVASGKGVRFIEIRLTPTDSDKLVGFAIQPVNVDNADIIHPRLRIEQSICHERLANREWYEVGRRLVTAKNDDAASPYLLIQALDDAKLPDRLSFGGNSLLFAVPDSPGPTRQFKLEFINDGKAVVLSPPKDGTSKELAQAFDALRYRPSSDGYFGLRILVFAKVPPDDSSTWPSDAEAAVVRHLVFVTPKFAPSDNPAQQAIYRARIAIANHLGQIVHSVATQLKLAATVSEIRSLVKAYFGEGRKAAIDKLTNIAKEIQNSSLKDAANNSLQARMVAVGTWKAETDAYQEPLLQADKDVRDDLEKRRNSIANIVSLVSDKDRKTIGAVRASAAETIAALDSASQTALPVLTDAQLTEIIDKFNTVGKLVVDVNTQVAEMAPISGLATLTGATIFRALVDRRKEAVGQIATAGLSIAAPLFTPSGEHDPIPPLATEAIKDRILNVVRNVVTDVEKELDVFFSPGGDVDWQHPNTVDKGHTLGKLLESVPRRIIEPTEPELRKLPASVQAIHTKLRELREKAKDDPRNGVLERLLSTWDGLIEQMSGRKQGIFSGRDLQPGASADVGAVLRGLESIDGGRLGGASAMRIEDLADILGKNAHILTQVAGVLDSSRRQLLFSILRQVTNASKEKQPRVYVLRSSANLFGWNSPLFKPGNREGLQEVFSLYAGLGVADPAKAKIKTFFDQLGIVPSASDATKPDGGPIITTDEAETESPRRLFLDGTYKKTVPGTIAAIQLSSDQPILAHRVKSSRLRPRDAYRINSNCTQLEFFEDCWHPTNEPPTTGEQKHEKNRIDTLSRARVWCDSEELMLAEAPIQQNIGLSQEIELDGVYFELSLGKKIIVRGRPVSVKTIQEEMKAELLEIVDIEHRKETRLFGDRFVTRIKVTGATSQSLRRDSVQFLANVAEATHGETVQEVLGGGDSSRQFQAFLLKRSPITRLPAPKPDGQESALAIRVNDVDWSYVAGFENSEEKVQSYSTRTGPDGQVLIVFGKYISRLPTGIENVRATYRVGLGGRGNIDKGRIDQLPSPPRGIKGVQNPIRASGGANPDSIAEAKDRLPLATLAANRLISVRDFGHFATLFAGIGQATADLIDGVVYVTIAAQEPELIETDSQLYRNLVHSLQLFGDPLQPFEVSNSEPSLLFIVARVRIYATHQWPLVSAQIRAVLLLRFGYAVARFGMAINLSNAIAVIQAVDGVELVDVDKFDAIAEQDRDNLAERLTKDKLRRLRRIQPLRARPNPKPPNEPIEVANADSDQEPSSKSAATQKPVLSAQLCYLPADVPDMLILEQM